MQAAPIYVYGAKVTVTDDPFFAGQTCTLVDCQSGDGQYSKTFRYLVLFSNGLQKWFLETSLKVKQ